MKYGLKTLYRIVSGDLNPAYRHADNVEHHVQLLQKYGDRSVRHIRIDFSRDSSEGFHIIAFQDYTLQGKDYPLLEDNMSFAEDLLLQDQLISKAVSKLNVSRNDIEKVHIRTYIKCIRLELALRQEFENLGRNEAKFYFYQLILSREVERIKHILQQEVLKLRTQKEIRLYIGHYQSTLENFSSLLLSCLPEAERGKLYKSSAGYTLDDIYKIIHRSVDDLRVYIDRHFTQYINVYAPMPYQSRIGNVMGMRTKIRSLYQSILHAPIDPGLVKLLKSVFKKISFETKQPGCTYKELIYYKILLREMQVVFQEEAVTTQSITGLLFRLNFNAVPFFNYLISKIEGDIAKKQYSADKLTILYHYHKLYKQQTIQLNNAVHESLPALKDQVVLWLKEEIAYHEKMQKIEKQDEKQSDALQAQPIKLKTSLSVAQVAYLMRVMYEAGIITADNQREIARFVSESMCTERTSKISFESLYSKYYNIETSTNRAIKEVIIRMLNYVNKDK